MRRRPKTIIILFIIFLLSFGKDLSLLLRYSTSADYGLFQTEGLGFLFIAFILCITALDGLTLWFLLRPKAVGFRIALSALAVSCVENIIAFAIAMKDLEAARQAYITSRQARGLVVKEEALDMIFTPTAMSLSLMVSIAFALIIGGLLVWKRGYFSGGKDSNSGQQEAGGQ